MIFLRKSNFHFILFTQQPGGLSRDKKFFLSAEDALKDRSAMTTRRHAIPFARKFESP